MTLWEIPNLRIMHNVTTLPLSLQPIATKVQTKRKGKQVGKQLRKEKHVNTFAIVRKVGVRMQGMPRHQTTFPLLGIWNFGVFCNFGK